MLELNKRECALLGVCSGICHLWVEMFLEYFEEIPVKGGSESISVLALP